VSRPDPAYPHVFSPFKVGAHTLRNRIVHASMTTRMSVNRRVTDALVTYYANRARGGAALIVTEPVSAACFQLAPHKVRVWDDECEPGLERWAAAVEREDCRLLAQIQDPGRGRHERGRNPEAFGVSALPDDLSWTVPHVLSAADIECMVEEFAGSSHRLQRCGFSGVELSAAHGHLFHQFLSPWMNAREDRYGGDLEGRCRMLTELVSAIRVVCGARFIVGIKLPGDDGIEHSIGPAEAALIARHLTGMGDAPRHGGVPKDDGLLKGGGVDYLCFAQGSHSASLDRHLPDLHGSRAPYVALTRSLKEAVPGVPVMALGLITDPAEADGILASGAADLIGLGRPLLTDPAWGLKARQGRAADIRYCVSCNSCWAAITEHRSIACDNNPRVGRADEVDWWPTPAARPTPTAQPTPAAARGSGPGRGPGLTRQRKRVVVVGTGIAGMEAAWIAAARGHEVIAFGTGAAPGGKTRLLAVLPGGEGLSSIYDYQALAAKKVGVRIEWGLRATPDDVRTLEPDSVIVAAGATMTWPSGFPAAWREEGVVLDLRACMADLLQFTRRQGGAAVIFDKDATEGTYASAELLRRLFDRVIIVTPRDRIAEDVPLVNRLGILRRFAHLGIESMTLGRIDASSALEEGVVRVANIYTGALTDIPDVVLLTYATPRAPDQGEIERFAVVAGEIHVIGDAYAPGTTMAATAHGHRIGNLI
jgi:2,4-dienoyl-CoA reductase-like NADH-dependent reductase (Old Yellow Enzyme family)